MEHIEGCVQLHTLRQGHHQCVLCQAPIQQSEGATSWCRQLALHSTQARAFCESCWPSTAHRPARLVSHAGPAQRTGARVLWAICMSRGAECNVSFCVGSVASAGVCACVHVRGCRGAIRGSLVERRAHAHAWASACYANACVRSAWARACIFVPNKRAAQKRQRKWQRTTSTNRHGALN